MDALNRSQIVLCPHCNCRVLPDADRTCPSCRNNIDEAPETEPDDIASPATVFEEEREPEEGARAVADEDADEEADRAPEAGYAEEDAKRTSEHAESYEPDEDAQFPLYDKYWQAADTINRRFRGTVVACLEVSVLTLVAAGIFGYRLYLQHNTGKILPVIGIGIGMALISIGVGIAQANKTIKTDIDEAVLNLPEFELFYNLSHPQLQSRVWTRDIDERTYEVFLRIVGKQEEQQP